MPQSQGAPPQPTSDAPTRQEVEREIDAVVERLASGGRKGNDSGVFTREGDVQRLKDLRQEWLGLQRGWGGRFRVGEPVVGIQHNRKTEALVYDGMASDTHAYVKDPRTGKRRPGTVPVGSLHRTRSAGTVERAGGPARSSGAQHVEPAGPVIRGNSEPRQGRSGETSKFSGGRGGSAGLTPTAGSVGTPPTVVSVTADRAPAGGWFGEAMADTGSGGGSAPSPSMGYWPTQELPPLAGQPVGKSFADFLEIPADARYDSVRRAVAAMERVHLLGQQGALRTLSDMGGPAVDRLPVRFDPNLAPNLGQYRYNALRYPEGIALLSSPYEELAHVHECGHFLDHVVIGTPYNFATVMDDPLVEDIWTAIMGSSAHQSLRNMYQTGVIPIVGGSGKTLNYRADRRHLKYLLDKKETFARAYSQYIALRSSDAPMRRQIDQLGRTSIPRSGGALFWRAGDFAPIVEKFDTLLFKKGWRQAP